MQKTLSVTSPAFSSGEWIPKIHTGDGEDISPALHLQGLCREAVSLAVILDD
ncbi:MAG: YbhB/YbcL family Raf kinase inhibitor-like protein, partial [Oscillibacter sp.]|nr:YbhB/YbcL family Raf kinase inhibitor-like protein [Oscillibacter sp.]